MSNEPNIDAAALPPAEETFLHAVPDPEPAAWLVCSVNSDGSLSLEHAAAWKDAAHEHINDAINEHDIKEATSWVVRPVYFGRAP
jgi:hypothetical protein